LRAAPLAKVSSDLRTVTSQGDLQKKLANLGSYANPMSADEVTAFVDSRQEIWLPVVREIAKTQKQ
jgi:tripartite-type tricarboxylate transporter receptor subunit TctC